MRARVSPIRHLLAILCLNVSVTVGHTEIRRAEGKFRHSYAFDNKASVVKFTTPAQ